jgi:hypothetical protein
MTATPSLERIERQAYRTTFADGLADICLGAWLAGFGLLMTTDYGWTGGVLGGLLLPIWRRLRERIAVPRLGHVSFGTERKERQARRWFGLRIGFLAVAAVLVISILFLRNGEQEPLGWGATPLGIAVAILLSALGLLYDFPRFLGHAALVLVVFFGGQTLGVHPPVYVAVAGAPILVVGVVLLALFLRRYSLPKEEEPDEPR